MEPRAVLNELIELSARFAVRAIAYDRSQIHMLVVEALRAGLPMREVSQAAGRAGGAMAPAHYDVHRGTPRASASVLSVRRTTTASRERPILAPAPAETAWSREVHAKKIDLAVALTLAVGVLYGPRRGGSPRPKEGWAFISAQEYLVSPGDYTPPTSVGSRKPSKTAVEAAALGYVNTGWYNDLWGIP